MSIETNHAAAGAAATTARGEMKKWYTNTTALNSAIAFGVICFALIINYSFELNFFWKLLMGGALVWGGGKLAAVKNDATKNKTSLTKVWGNLFRGLGWAIVVIALLKSGVRLVAEKTVLSVDQTLTEMATGQTGLDSGSSVLSKVLGETTYVKFDLRSGVTKVAPMGITAIAVVEMPRPKANTGQVYWACPTVVGPVLTKKPDLEVVAGARTFTHQFALTEESRVTLAKDGIPAVRVAFVAKVATRGAPSPC